jgi:pimeloyl-ACP methyl ester carboxylesterase
VRSSGFIPTAFAVKVSGQGCPIIFLPGFACGGSVWDGTVAQLNGFESHVVTFAGIAGQPAVPAGSLAEVHAQLERYIVDNRLDRPIIVGHSLGGTMALWLGETLADNVGGIVDIDGTAFLPALNDPTITHEKASAIGTERAAKLAALAPDELGPFIRQMMGNMFSKPEDLERVVADAAKSDIASLAAYFADGFSKDLRADLGKITQHVTLIVASATPQSEQLQANWRAHVSGISNIDFVFVESKHFVMFDQPDRFYALLDRVLARAT